MTKGGVIKLSDKLKRAADDGVVVLLTSTEAEYLTDALAAVAHIVIGHDDVEEREARNFDPLSRDQARIVSPHWAPCPLCEHPMFWSHVSGGRAPAPGDWCSECRETASDLVLGCPDNGSCGHGVMGPKFRSLLGRSDAIREITTTFNPEAEEWRK